MKKLIVLMLLLSGCENPPDLQLGDKVKVVKGFYKDCLGLVMDSDIYTTSCKYKSITLREVVCPKVTMNFVILKACDVEKVK